MRKLPAVDVEPPSVDNVDGLSLESVAQWVVDHPAVIVIGVLTLIIAGILKKPFVRGAIVVGGIVGLIVYVYMSQQGS